MIGSPTSRDKNLVLLAAGSVTGASGVAPIAGGASPKLRGVAAANIVRLGAGSYTIQLPGGEPQTSCVINLMPIGVAATNINLCVVSWSAAGLITLASNVNSTAVATDVDFVFDIWRYLSNQ